MLYILLIIYVYILSWWLYQFIITKENTMLELKDIKIDYTLSPTDLDLNLELLPEFYNVASVGPRLRVMDWHKSFYVDMITNKGFIVKTKPFKKKKKIDRDGNILKGLKEKEMDGIHSPRFGSDWQDENAFAERYRCTCGETIGKFYVDQICPSCNSKVKFVDVDLKMFAWLKIQSPFYMIQPLMYVKIADFIGKDNMAQIIDFKKDMDINGYYRETVEVNPKNPFAGIGMTDFYDRFDEIMEFFKKKKKNKASLYDNIMMDRHKIFVQEIPVFSAVLRPVFFTNEDYSYTKIDRLYNAMFGNIERLNDELDGLNLRNIAKVNKNLHKAQLSLNEVYKLVFKSLTEKEGHIRCNILGGKVNFSARNVIIPDDRLRSYQVRLPYVTFVELYKEEIINLIVKLTGVSYNIAVDEWFNAYREFDPKIYQIIKYMLKNTKNGNKILLNRNPTIDFGSFLCMEVADVKADYDDLSTSLPISILTALNADFDGDVLNIISLKTNELKKAFDTVFNPHKSLIIDRNTGRFNSKHSLIKDQLIGLYQFCNI